jgi:hypothetical protein
MDYPIDLEKCESYCNERQVFPAMRYFVKEKGMAIREASREVNKLTEGRVTADRADKVYRDRTPATNVAPPTEPPKIKRPRLTDAEKEKIISDEFKVGFATFFKAVKNAKHEKFKKTTREAVLKHLEILYDVTVN